MKRKWFPSISILIILVLVEVISFSQGAGGALAASTSDPRIYISSDSVLESEADDNGWNGNGSKENPFIIENLTIDGESGWYCIKMTNITHSVVVRNCTLFNASGSKYSNGISYYGAGIYLENSSGVSIENCTFYHNKRGVDSRENNDILVRWSTFENNTYPIVFDQCNDTILENNSISSSDSRWGSPLYPAIRLSRCNFTKVINGTAEMPFHNALRTYDSNELHIDGLLGQEIDLYRTNFSSVKNTNHQRSYGSHVGVFGSKNVSIQNSTMDLGGYNGMVRLNRSENCTVSDCHLDDTSYGISIEDSNNITILENEMGQISKWSIRIMGSEDVVIHDQNNRYCPGFVISRSSRVNIMDQRFDQNTSNRNNPSIQFTDSDNCSVYNSEFYSRGEYTLRSSFSDNISIINCTLVAEDEYPVYLETGSTHFKFVNSTIDSTTGDPYHGKKMGMYIYSNTGKITLFNNNITGALFFTEGVSRYRDLEVPENNTIAGGKFRVFKDLKDLNLPSDTGQFALFNVENVMITGVTHSGTCQYNVIEGVSNITIHNNTFRAMSGQFIYTKGMGRLEVQDNRFEGHYGRLIGGSDIGFLRFNNNFGEDIYDSITYVTSGGDAEILNNRISGLEYAGSGNERLFYLGDFKNISAKDNIFSTIGPRAFSFRIYDSATVTNNSISGADNSISVDSETDHARITIENNSVNDTLFAISMFRGRGSIKNNRVNGSENHGINVWSSQNLTISKNVITNCSEEGILLERMCKNVTISENKLLNNNIGISLDPYSGDPSGSSNIVIENNSILKNTAGGILCYGMQALIKNNTIEDGVYGLNGGCHDSIISGNYFRNFSRYAVNIRGNNIEIANNTMEFSRFGIHTDQSSGESGIEYHHNHISHSEVGIRLFSGTNTNFSYNIVENCGEGIWNYFTTKNVIFSYNIFQNNYGLAVNLSNSVSDVVFHHNAFLFNNGTGDTLNVSNRQAYSRFQGVTWNDGNGEGNYWADLSGPDVDQNDLVDIPYPVPGNDTVDRFPLSYLPFIENVGNITLIPTQGGVRISWEEAEVTIGDWKVTGYEVFRRSLLSPLVRIASMDENSHLFIDSNFSKEEDFWYAVRAISEQGNGPLNVVDSAFSPDIYPPSIDILFPSKGVVINTSTIVFTWVAIDNVSGVIKTDIRIDEGEWIDVGDQMNWTVGPLPDGPHLLEVRCTDLVNRVALERVSFKVDTTPPDIHLVNQLEGAFHNSSELPLTWEYTLDDSGITSALMILNGGRKWDVTPVTEFLLKPLIDGVHRIEFTLMDGAGNGRSRSFEFTVDTIYPTIEKVDGFETWATRLDQHTFTWSSGDIGSGVHSAEGSINGLDWFPLSINGSYELSMVEDGTHQFQIRLTDRAGNSLITSHELTRDTVAPIISIDIPQVSFTNENSFVISVITSDNDTYVSKVTPFIDGIEFDEINGNSSLFTVNLDGEGEHFLMFRVFDGAGNQDEIHATVIFDSLAPDLIWDEIDDQHFLPGQEITLNFNEPVLLSLNSQDGIGLVEEVDRHQRNHTLLLDDEVEWGEEIILSLSATDRAGNTLISNSRLVRIYPLRDVTFSVSYADGQDVDDLMIEVSGDGTYQIDDEDQMKIRFSPGSYLVEITGDGIKGVTVEINITPGLDPITEHVTVERDEKKENYQPDIFLILGILLLLLVIIAVVFLLVVRSLRRSGDEGVPSVEGDTENDPEDHIGQEASPLDVPDEPIPGLPQAEQQEVPPPEPEATDPGAPDPLQEQANMMEPSLSNLMEDTYGAEGLTQLQVDHSIEPPVDGVDESGVDIPSDVSSEPPQEVGQSALDNQLLDP